MAEVRLSSGGQQALRPLDVVRGLLGDFGIALLLTDRGRQLQPLARFGERRVVDLGRDLRKLFGRLQSIVQNAPRGTAVVDHPGSAGIEVLVTLERPTDRRNLDFQVDVPSIADLVGEDERRPGRDDAIDEVIAGNLEQADEGIVRDGMIDIPLPELEFQ